MKKSADNSWVGNPYRRPNSPYWHIVFEDASGITRRKSTKTRDKRIAQEFLAATLQTVEKTKLGHVDRYAEVRKVPVARLIEDHRDHLETEERAPKYVTGTIRQLREFVSFAKVTTLPSIQRPDVERFLADVRRRRSAKTRDHYAGALRSFGRWLERTGRWERDPFHGVRVRTPKRDKHRVFKRVSFRFEEAEQLVESAWARHEAEKHLAGTPRQQCYANGEVVRDRQVLYWFALTTAFRANECGACQRE